jgi:hypothetical protein
VQWDFYNLMFSYVRRDGSGGYWDEEQRENGVSSKDMINWLRLGPLAPYADLFQRYLATTKADSTEEDGVVFLRAVMLSVVELVARHATLLG